MTHSQNHMHPPVPVYTYYSTNYTQQQSFCPDSGVERFHIRSHSDHLVLGPSSRSLAHNCHHGDMNKLIAASTTIPCSYQIQQRTLASDTTEWTLTVKIYAPPPMVSPLTTKRQSAIIQKTRTASLLFVNATSTSVRLRETKGLNSSKRKVTFLLLLKKKTFLLSLQLSFLKMPECSHPKMKCPSSTTPQNGLNGYTPCSMSMSGCAHTCSQTEFGVQQTI